MQTESLTASLAGQVEAAMEAIRVAPHAPGARLALFQLDCIRGNWKRARAQLDVLARLDPKAAVFVARYQGLIDAEIERESVFAGRTRPVSLGEPPEWLAMMVRALEHDAAGEATAATALRQLALEAAPAQAGTVDGTTFTWIMDADVRLGPILEIMVDQRYRWLALENLLRLRASPPEAPCDLVWQPVILTLTTGRETEAFVPVRYPGAGQYPLDAVQLAQVTKWSGPNVAQIGHGQRLLAADDTDFPLLDIRALDLLPNAGDDFANG